MSTRPPGRLGAQRFGPQPNLTTPRGPATRFATGTRPDTGARHELPGRDVTAPNIRHANPMAAFYQHTGILFINSAAESMDAHFGSLPTWPRGSTMPIDALTRWVSRGDALHRRITGQWKGHIGNQRSDPSTQFFTTLQQVWTNTLSPILALIEALDGALKSDTPNTRTSNQLYNGLSSAFARAQRTDHGLVYMAGPMRTAYATPLLRRLSDASQETTQTEAGTTFRLPVDSTGMRGTGTNVALAKVVGWQPSIVTSATGIHVTLPTGR